MKITLEKLLDWSACSAGRDWFLNQKETDAIKIIEKLISPEIREQIGKEYREDGLNWANWLIVRVVNLGRLAQYASYAAKKVLPLFEKAFPNDPRPRKAIAAARAVPFATDAAITAANDAIIAANTNQSVYNAAIAAARTAWAAVAAADADTDRAISLAIEAVGAATRATLAITDIDTYDNSLIDIIQFGIKLIKKEER